MKTPAHSSREPLCRKAGVSGQASRLAIPLVLLVLLVLLIAVPVQARPVCDACGKPLEGSYYRMPDGRCLCPEDYERRRPRCQTCNRAIEGRYVLLEGDRPVCRSCFDRYPHCFVCSIPVDKQGRRLCDGRILCPDHALRGIYDDEGGWRAFQEASLAAREALGLRLRHQVSAVKVVDQKSLARVFTRHSASVARDVLGLFRLETRGQERRYTVYLVSGLPPERLVTVAAHEFGHVWHSENHPDYAKCDNRLREGFAEWVAWRANQWLGRQAELDVLLAQREEDYIEGLRGFLEMEKRLGTPEVLRAATTRRRL